MSSTAPLCSGETVYVVGGGNSAGQAVIHFSAYSERVVMVVRGAELSETLSQYLVTKIEHGREPTHRSVKNLSYEFKSDFRRLGFSPVSASIDDDRSIF